MNKRLAALLVAGACLCLFLGVLGCRPARSHPHPPVPATPAMTCLRIASLPTGPAMRDSAKAYCLGYEVLDTLALDAAAQGRLRAALSDPASYVDGHARACECMPVYGILLDGVDVLVSGMPCPKLLWHTAARDTVWDLVEGNGVLGVLGGR
jgi:hypothetical protein